MDYNRCTLLGNVGNDPKIHKFANGGATASFSMATTRKYKAGDQLKEQTTWHNVCVFGDGRVKVVEDYVRKGSRVFVEGEYRSRSYEQDGQVKWVMELIVAGSATLILLGKAGGSANANKPYETDTARVPDDEIPF